MREVSWQVIRRAINARLFSLDALPYWKHAPCPCGRVIWRIR